MAANDDDDVQTSRARPKLSALRTILTDTRETDDAERIRAALIEVVEGLIGQAEAQARELSDLRSDVGHKQSIVTKIGGGDYQALKSHFAPLAPRDRAIEVRTVEEDIWVRVRWSETLRIFRIEDEDSWVHENEIEAWREAPHPSIGIGSPRVQG